MAHVSLRHAETEADFNDARALCWAGADWLLKSYPQWEAEILEGFEPVAYGRMLDALPAIHARPGGAVLLGALDGETVGCVMYLEAEPGVAEIRRLFVDEIGRGHGIGRALMREAMVRMRQDGHSVARLWLPEFLSHARQLFAGLGFAAIPAPQGTPEFLCLMQRAL